MNEYRRAPDESWLIMSWIWAILFTGSINHTFFPLCFIFFSSSSRTIIVNFLIFVIVVKKKGIVFSLLDCNYPSQIFFNPFIHFDYSFEYELTWLYIMDSKNISGPRRNSFLLYDDSGISRDVYCTFTLKTVVNLTLGILIDNNLE